MGFGRELHSEGNKFGRTFLSMQNHLCLPEQACRVHKNKYLVAAHGLREHRRQKGRLFT
jgi:hypothetical protein